MGYLMVGTRHDVYRYILLERVSQRVFPAESDREEVVLEGLERIREIAPIDSRVVLDDDAASTLVRGFGFCDGISMAYVQLLERAGMRGRLTFLRRPDGSSPHTIAEVQLGGEWRVIDVFTGRVSRTKDGELATAADIATGRAPTTHDVEPAVYGNTHAFYTSPEESEGGVRGVTRVFAAAANRAGAGLIQDLYLRRSPPPMSTTAGAVWEDWANPGDRAYWRARHYQLFGRMERAADAYRTALDLGTSRSADARLFLARVRD